MEKVYNGSIWFGIWMRPWKLNNDPTATKNHSEFKECVHGLKTWNQCDNQIVTVKKQIHYWSREIKVVSMNIGNSMSTGCRIGGKGEKKGKRFSFIFSYFLNWNHSASQGSFFFLFFSVLLFSKNSATRKRGEIRLISWLMIECDHFERIEFRSISA